MKKFDVKSDPCSGLRTLRRCSSDPDLPSCAGLSVGRHLGGNISWSAILTHEGAWDPLSAVALSMWAGSSVLSVLGLVNPLRWIPLVLFEIAYKTIWLGVVAYPLWTMNQLVGSPAEDMALSFVPVVFPILVMPWGYVWRTYVWPRHRSLSTRVSVTVVHWVRRRKGDKERVIRPRLCLQRSYARALCPLHRSTTQGSCSIDMFSSNGNSIPQ